MICSNFSATQSRDSLLRHWRSLSLTGQFLIAASAVVLLGMAALGLWVSDRIKRGVVHSTAAAAALQIDSIVAPHLQELYHSDVLSQHTLDKLDGLVGDKVGARVVRLKVWRTDGTVVYSSKQDQIGKRFALTPNMRRALAGRIGAEFEGRPHEGLDNEHRVLGGALLEIYAPVHETSSGRIIGIVEYYSLELELAAQLLRAGMLSWVVVGAVAMLMMTALSSIVRAGSRTIENQRCQLQTQVAELEALLNQNLELRNSVQRAHNRTAILNERVLRRIGADLHDGPAQHVCLAMLLVDSLPGGKRATDNVEDVERIRSALADAVREIRLISSGLVLPEIREVSPDEVIRLAASAHAQRTGTKVACTTEGLPPKASERFKVGIFRFVQEALNNSFKHAGGNGQRVKASYSGDCLEICVSDQGPGLRTGSRPSDNAGLGLIGLRDRIETLGGKIMISSFSTGLDLTARFELGESWLVDGDDVGSDHHSRY